MREMDMESEQEVCRQNCEHNANQTKQTEEKQLYDIDTVSFMGMFGTEFGIKE